MSDMNDLLAKLPEIRKRYKAIPQHAWDFDRQIRPIPSDLDALLELVDGLLNDHEPHIAALEKRLAEIEAELSQANIDYLQVTNGGRDLSGYEPAAPSERESDS